MSSKRRRSARLDPARFRLGSKVEALESRQLLTQSPYLSANSYPLSDNLPVENPGLFVQRLNRVLTRAV